MKTQHNEPISIGAYSRNERLLQTLLNMGLVVIPQYLDEKHQIIDHFIVSAGMPKLVKDQGQDQG